MLNTARAIIKQGRVELLNPVEIPEGTEVLVTFNVPDDKDFWLGVSQSALDKIWNNPADDIYEQLLTR
ncbi:hypothetical protein [Methylomagnum sp.]